MENSDPFDELLALWRRPDLPMSLSTRVDHCRRQYRGLLESPSIDHEEMIQAARKIQMTDQWRRGYRMSLKTFIDDRRWIDVEHLEIIICRHCGKEFLRERISTEVIFCSGRCEYRYERNEKVAEFRQGIRLTKEDGK